MIARRRWSVTGALKSPGPARSARPGPENGPATFRAGVWPKPATTRCRRRRSRTSWVRGYRLPALRPKHLDLPGYFVAGGCAVVAGCSMIVAWPALQTRSSTGEASSGSSAWKVANWQSTPQQIAFAVISTGGSSWSIAVTFEDLSGVYPSPISSAPPASRYWRDCRTGSSRSDRACLSRCRLASDDGRRGYDVRFAPQNRHRQLDRQCPESANNSGWNPWH